MNRWLLAAGMAAWLVLPASHGATPPETPTATYPASATDPALLQHPPAPPVAQPFKPGMDDLMTMLVQPRHLKLYYAGSQKNWELAAAELRDLTAAFARIGTVIPQYQDSGVDEAVKSIIAPKLQAVDATIGAADAKQFAVAFKELTAACNGCHAYMEHPFIVISVPDAAVVYPNQNFSPIP